MRVSIQILAMTATLGVTATFPTVPNLGGRRLHERVSPLSRQLYAAHPHRRLGLMRSDIFIEVNCDSECYREMVEKLTSLFIPCKARRQGDGSSCPGIYGRRDAIEEEGGKVGRILSWCIEKFENFQINRVFIEVQDYFNLMGVIPRLEIDITWRGNPKSLRLEAPGSLNSIGQMVLQKGKGTQLSLATTSARCFSLHADLSSSRPYFTTPLLTTSSFIFTFPAHLVRLVPRKVARKATRSPRGGKGML